MDKHLKAASFITKLMDNEFKIWKFSFGLDPVLGLFPGLGDLIAALLSLYLVWIGIQHNLPKSQVTRMIANIILDFLLGAIPVIGDVSDLFYKSNSINLKILKEYSND